MIDHNSSSLINVHSPPYLPNMLLYTQKYSPFQILLWLNHPNLKHLFADILKKPLNSASYIKLLIIDDKIYTFINAHSPFLPQTQFLTAKKQTLMNSQFPKNYSPPLLFNHHLCSYILWEILIPNLTIMIDCMGSSIIHKKSISIDIGAYGRRYFLTKLVFLWVFSGKKVFSESFWPVFTNLLSIFVKPWHPSFKETLLGNCTYQNYIKHPKSLIKSFKNVWKIQYLI